MTKVNIEKKILSANEEQALVNRKIVQQHNLVCFNMISSPGSGKTTILTRTITDLKGELRIGVIEGDIATDLDTQRIRATQAPAVQINTAGACHLSASQVTQGLLSLPLEQLDLVFIENVGNLVCPSAFELGENGKIAVLSVAEGDDKPVKYPALFAKAQALLINKTDLLATGVGLDFSVDRVSQDAHRLNKALEIFPVSAKTGQGMDAWYDWLRKSVAKTKQKQ